MRPLAFQLLRELSHERFVSGARLAEKFGVSRSAVSDALRDASEAGVDIFSLTRRGYRLAEPIELLGFERIRIALGLLANRLDVAVVENIASTNSELMQRATTGAASGTCLVAEIQTAGRGRRGRVWQSAFGASLTFSLLWRFERGAAQLGGLSLVVGLAVLRALHKLGITANDIALKWPNDIVAGSRKLAGILIETQGDVLGPTAVVIGIGINVNLPEQLKAAIDQPVTDLRSLVRMSISRNQLLAEVLRELVGILDKFQAKGFPPFKNEWTAVHSLHGKPVRVLSGDGSVKDAVVRDVADDGSLIVNCHGRDIALASGEISLRSAVSHK
ncbi:MAG: biotin--[acetyl-CoA-carboxylase] ligase [Betaproteobacteria bacterium]|nr:biotin--[acetyl-CoA-carboxylase] ligase [Betaproteobacteria bacterium]